MVGESYISGSADETLIRRIVGEGSEGSRRELYDRYVGRVFSQCLVYRGLSRGEAEDLVQEIFLAAFSQLHTLREPARFGSWLAVITRNRCLQHLQRTARAGAAERSYEKEYEAHGAPADEALMREREIGIVHELIAAVPEAELRRTVELFYIEGLPCEEIARTQGLSVTAVTTRLMRFRARVQRELIRRVLELRSHHG